MKKTAKKNTGLILWMPFLLLVGACGGGGGSSDVALSFRLGAVVSSEAVSGGGMVYGQNTTNGDRWAQVIAAGTTNFSREMNNGTWNFQMIAWDGAVPLTGTVRCASVSGVSLTGEQKDVSLSLATANCNSTITNAAYTADATYGIAPLRLVACTNLFDISSGSDNCNFPLEKVGMGQSYRVVMMSYVGTDRTEAITSACISHANLIKHKRADSVFFSNVRIPIGGTSGTIDIRVKSFDDKNCTVAKFNRDYDFISGIGVPRSNLALAADNYKSTGDVDHIVKVTSNPYGSGSYVTTQSNYMAIDIEYVQGYNGIGCNCDALPDDLKAACNQDTSADGGTSSTCPAIGNGAVTFVGSGFGGGSEAKCFGDYSNDNGPNCDAGTIKLYRVSCKADGVNYLNPLICELKGSESINCGGEGLSCRFGTNAPQFVSLYLADNIFASAGTPFVAQAPDFKCGSGHCVPMWIPDGSGSGSGSSGPGINGAVRGAASDVFGTFDGEKSWRNNVQSCIQKSTVTVTGSGSGSGSSYTVNWRQAFPSEVVTCNSMYGSNDDDYIEVGMIGNIREMLIGDGIGGFLWNLGYTTCASIPSSGQTSAISFIEEGQTRSFYLSFDVGNAPNEYAPYETVTMPAFGSGSGGGSFEKKITLHETTPGTLASLRWIYHYNCTTNLKTGHIWSNWDEYESDGKLSREKEEAYYDTNNLSSAKIEFVKSHQTGSNSDYRSRVRAEKMNTNEYAIWQSRVEGSTYSYGSTGSGSGSGGSGSGGGFYGVLPSESVGNIAEMGSGSGKLNWRGNNLLVRGNTTEAKVLFSESSFFGNISKPRLPYVQFDNNIFIYSSDYQNANGLIYELTNVDTDTPTAISTGSGYQSDVNQIGSSYPITSSESFVGIINTNLGAVGSGSELFASTKQRYSPIYSSSAKYFLNGAPANSILPGNITMFLQDIYLYDCRDFGTGLEIDINSTPVTVFNSTSCNIKIANPTDTPVSAQSIYVNGHPVTGVSSYSSISPSCLQYDGSIGSCSVPNPTNINLVNSPFDVNEFSVDWLLNSSNLP
ncbi:MAG: hypothetical protein HYV97_18670 [Bdellovibrio sp.]|nr:hypothetical protein [Bdellovibrio sp.]